MSTAYLHRPQSCYRNIINVMNEYKQISRYSISSTFKFYMWVYDVVYMYVCVCDILNICCGGKNNLF